VRTNYGTTLCESDITISDDRNPSQWVDVEEFLWRSQIWAALVELNLIGHLEFFLGRQECISKRASKGDE
jgi:hypothetical protein